LRYFLVDDWNVLNGGEIIVSQEVLQ
jgi:hypothetical protein